MLAYKYLKGMIVSFFDGVVMLELFVSTFQFQPIFVDLLFLSQTCCQLGANLVNLENRQKIDEGLFLHTALHTQLCPINFLMKT